MWSLDDICLTHRVHRATFSSAVSLPTSNRPRSISQNVVTLLDLRQMPTTYAWLTFAEWGRKYGPINYISIAGKSAIVINTHEAALDLLEKRAAIYSDRPRFVMASELCGARSAFRPPIKSDVSHY